MVNLEKMNVEELNNNQFLTNQIMDLYGEVSGDFFSYCYNGEERWLYRDDLYCTILGLDGEYVLYTSFMIDEEYNLFYMDFDDFIVSRSRNGEMLLWQEGSPIAESLAMQKRSKRASINDLDGLITHYQVNFATKEELIIAYKTLYKEKQEFFQSNFLKPLAFSFINDGKVEQYLEFTTNIDNLSYDLITIREYGLTQFLQNGSYALQKDKSITRYFKIRGQKSDGTCLLFYPFFKGYTLEEMDALITQKGFKRDVCDNMLDYYNGNYLECDEYKELALAIKNYVNSTGKEKNLVKSIKRNVNVDSN